MDKSKLVSAIVTETQEAIAGGGHRRAAHKSPFKKSASQYDSASAKLVSAPSDANIKTWAEKVLLHKTGISPARFDEAVFKEVRKTATHLQNVNVFRAYEVTDFLINTVKLTLNHAVEQLEVLRKTIRTAEEKSKLSTNQLTHDRIGTQQSLRDSLKPEIQKKQINTTGVI